MDNIMMDGISIMDTGSNGLMGGLNIPTDQIAEVKIVTLELPGRIWTLERPSDFGRHQERDQRVPWHALLRQARLEVECQHLGQHSERDRQARRQPDGLGVHDRRAGREAARTEPPVLLLRPGIPAAHERRRDDELPIPDGARAPGRFLAVARSERRALHRDL
jgi:hypothetical protein